jgi:hypothetical protein
VKKSLFHTEVTKFNVGFQWQIGVFQVEILLKYYEISDKVRYVARVSGLSIRYCPSCIL